ncbi:hypothetical protein KAT80_02110 [Candidatus Pacearchaeota archaeon]|nr:hypothetical protein [Candidatus Pacearchaeota archaeon]
MGIDENEFWDRTIKEGRIAEIANEMITDWESIEPKYRGLLKKAVQYHTMFGMRLGDMSIYLKYRQLKEDYEQGLIPL